MTTTTNRLLGGALYYASKNWKILPCHGVLENGLCTCGGTHSDPKDIGKHPAIANWQNAATDDSGTVQSWWHQNPRYNIGVMCRNSGFFVVDIDPRSGGFESFARFEELVAGDIPDTVTAITGSYAVRGGSETVRGKHLFFKISETESLHGKIDGLPGIDIKHNGYVLLNPSNHISGVEYGWAPGHAPWEMEMAEPSEKMLDLLRKRKSRGTGYLSSSWSFIDDLDWGGDRVDVERFLQEGIEEGSRAVDIYKLTCAIANRYPRLDEMDRKNIETMMIRFNHEMVRPPLELEGSGGLLYHVHRAIDFVASNPKTDVAKKMLGMGETMLKNVTGGIPAATAIRTSDPDDAFSVPVSSEGFSSSISISKDFDAVLEEDGGEIGRRTLTDTGNGRRLVDTFGRSLRYTPGLGWFVWNGEYWKPDVEELSVKELSKQVAAILGAEAAVQEDADTQKKYLDWGRQAKSNARQSSAVESAQSDPRIALSVDDWDRNPYMLGAANGVVDLRTGSLLVGRPDLYITKRSPIAYSPSFSNLKFQQFLDFATYGDKEFQEWLQKAFGYTLTGLNHYDVLFLVYGPPGSGKNVLVESLVKLLGTKQYAFPMDSSVLAQGDGRSNSSDQYYWAELRGKRMVWIDELPESERLKENSVKKLTGSTEIGARSPGEKPFTFDSHAKMWVTTNHRPIITDEAMWRRLRPIPWTNVPSTPDPTLKAYLHDPEGGLPAVLAWAVEGAVKLLSSKEPDALGWCRAVSDAAEVYKKNEDKIGLFLDEETVVDITGSTPVRSLYTIYKSWADTRGERPLSQVRFTNKLTDRGLNISGFGTNAILLERNLVAKSPENTSNSSGLDWDSLIQKSM